MKNGSLHTLEAKLAERDVPKSVWRDTGTGTLSHN